MTGAKAFLKKKIQFLVEEMLQTTRSDALLVQLQNHRQSIFVDTTDHKVYSLEDSDIFKQINPNWRRTVRNRDVEF